MSLIQNIYGSLFVNNNITGNTLTLSSITNDNSLTQILARNNDGLVEYVDVNSIITGATSQDTFTTGFTYNDANTLTISRNDGVDLSASINTMTGLTINGNLLLPDGGVGGPYIGIGDAEDLKIFHNGNHSIIRETGTGSLYLQSDNNVILSKDSGTELMVRGIADGAVELYYDNVKKIETISDGVDVSGDIVIGNGKFKYTTTGDGGSQLVLAKTQYSVQNNTVLSSVGSINLFLDSLTADTSGDVAFRIFNDTDPDGTVTESNNIFKIADSGDVTITGGITGNTLTLSQTPTLNNSGTDILIRNSSTGEVEYRPVSGITTTDNFVSGGTYNSGTSEINFVGNSTETTFDVDLSSLISSVSGDTFVVSGNADVATSQLTFTNNSGGTFNVTNSAALFSDNDINVTGGTYNPSNGCVTFTTNSGTTFDVCGFLTGFTDTYVTGGTVSVSATDSDNSGTIGLFYKNSDGIPRTLPFEDTFTTGATYDNGTALATFKKNDGTSYTLNLSSLTGGTSDTNSFSTGGTVTQTATSGSSEVIVQIVGNDGFTPYNITGLTDTFINDFSFSSNTFTISQNDGSTFEADVDTIDLANILSAVTFNIATTGTISATTFNGGTFNGTFVGDGSGLTGITDNDTFVTGTTFSSNQAVLTRNDGTDVFLLTGGTNVTLSNPSTNQIKVDVTLPSTMNTFTTGFTYNNANTLTIERNDGVNLSTSINTMTGLTVNGTLSATTYFGDGSNLTGISSEDNFVTGGTFSSEILTLNRQNGSVTITGFTSTPSLNNGEIFVGDTGNTAQSVAMTGDVNIDNTGLTTIQPDVVTYDKMQDVTQRAILGSENVSGGTVTEIPVVDQFLTTGTVPSQLSNTSNWDINGNYTGSTISGTFQSQMYYDGNYFFIAVLDNVWIRLIRG